MRNLLVTGGAGFIGANFVHHMLQKYSDYTITVYDKLTYAGNMDNLKPVANDPRLRFVQGDIADAAAVEAALRDHDIDTLVNFAAETHVDRSILQPDAFIKTNVYGTYVLLEAMKKLQLERGLFVSTDEVYGHIPAGYSSKESDPLVPRSPYSASKAASDHLVRAWHHTYGLPVVLTNCSNNYGPYHFPEKLIPLTILNALEGKPLPVYGRGENVRDWLYVEDHARALWLVLTRGRPGESYNVGGAAERRNIEVVRAV
ncbi:MAG TPA: dTDP-glucose 4,6-dehydratase, partial [Herpetosiphonaceae bacterium]|nr:dTDP-glucose 4,6-dehydratase [Herpetosiphonaceae bacterium]